MVYLFGKFFALRSGEEHRSLTFAQLEVIEGDEKERANLHAYQRESSREREAVSDVLQNSKSSFLEGSSPKNVKTQCQEGKYTFNNCTFVFKMN